MSLTRRAPFDRCLTGACRLNDGLNSILKASSHPLVKTIMDVAEAPDAAGPAEPQGRVVGGRVVGGARPPMRRTNSQMVAARQARAHAAPPSPIKPVKHWSKTGQMREPHPLPPATARRTSARSARSSRLSSQTSSA